MTVQPAPTEQAAPEPNIAGTFAVYLMPDGSAGLVLDIAHSAQGPAGVTRHHVPSFVVDMVLYGRRPSPATIFQMMKGGRSAGTSDLGDTAGTELES